MYTQSRRKSSLAQEAFSFIEIVVVMAIIGLIAAVAVPAYLNYVERAKMSKAEATIQNVKTSMLQYNVDVSGYPRTLRELANRPTDERGKKWRGPYMQEVPEDDPWGNPYVYRVTPGQRNPYELYSLGAKGSEGVKEDRIGVWN